MASCKTAYISILSDKLAKVFDRNSKAMPDGKYSVSRSHPVFVDYPDELARIETIATSLGFEVKDDSELLRLSKKGEFLSVYSAVVNKTREGDPVIQWLGQSVALATLPEGILAKPMEKDKKTLMYVEYGDEDNEYLYIPFSLKYDEVEEKDDQGKPVTRRVYPEFEAVERAFRKGKLAEFLAQQQEKPISLGEALQQNILVPGVYQVTEVRYTKFKPMVKVGDRYFKANSKLTELLADKPEVSNEKPAQLSLVGLKKDDTGALMKYNGYVVVDLDFVPFSDADIQTYDW